MRPKAIHKTSTLGFTVVELLIASTILVVVLGIAGVFFARQTQMQRSTQGRNELQDRVRVSMQLVTQDLALAGNSAVIDGTGSKTSTLWPTCFDGGKGCLVVADAGTSLQVRYLSSQFPVADACRDVAYRLDAAGVLERSDVACGAAAAYLPLASNLVRFGVDVQCSNGTTSTTFPVSTCPPGASYGRSATVRVMGQSRTPLSGPSITGCPTDRLCFEMTQEVQLPNMKDQ